MTWDNLKNLNFKISKGRIVGNGNKKFNFVEIPAAFDIETTTMRIWGEIHPFLYAWHFLINDQIFFGRTWQEFNQFLIELNQTLNGTYLIVAVHNLAYEYNFMKSWVNFDEVFKNSRNNSPYYARYGTIKFIDTYKLSGVNLKEFTKGGSYEKIDNFDYDKIRFPDTPLTAEEKKYMEYDVLGLQEALLKFMADHKISTVLELPLTSSGFAKNMCKTQFKVHPYKVPKLPYECLKELQLVMEGGYVNANPTYISELVSNVDSLDANSMYPSVLCTEYYPIGNWNFKSSVNENLLNYYTKSNFAWIAKLTITNVRLKKNFKFPFLKFVKYSDGTYSASRTSDIENGRIKNCEKAIVYMNDIDFIVFKDHYDYSDLTIEDFWYSAYGYLPIELRSLIIDQWELKNKTKKNSRERSLAKIFINTISGAMGQNPLYPIIETDETGQPKLTETGNYVTHEVSKEEYEARKTFNQWNNYSWFVWTTSHGRKRLARVLDAAGDFAIYCDTDAVKFEQNSQIYERVKKINEDIQNLNYKAGAPLYMGIFRSEGVSDRFITLGPKMYCCENVYLDNELIHGLKIVCSGLHGNQQNIDPISGQKMESDAVKQLREDGGITAFKPGYIFKTGLTSVPINYQAKVVSFKGHSLELGSGVIIEPAMPFELSIDGNMNVALANLFN